MASGAEAARKSGMGVELTSLEFEDLATTVAAEVMMVGFASDLIAQGLTRHRDRRQPIDFQQ